MAYNRAFSLSEEGEQVFEKLYNDSLMAYTELSRKCPAGLRAKLVEKALARLE